VAETRRYDSAVRLAKTRRTRVRILDAARALFLADGYVGTTLDAVAARAGVSPQTVYNLVGNKATLFKTVYDVTLAGDDEPIPLSGRPEFEGVLDATSGRAALVAYANICELLWTRVGPLVQLATAQAAAGDRDLRTFVETIETERLTGTHNIVRYLDDRFGLRPGLTVAEGTDVVWTLTGPDVVERLVVRRGWSWPRWREWLVATVHHGLFGEPA
jgi:AcrR family transcriptional regulator